MADPRGEPAPSEPDATADAPTLVVGLGASAGGITALSEFFSRAPVEAPFAYVVILHLSPDHDSRLAEVLQTSTAMPVVQVRDTTPLQARRVYVIPPSQTLSVSDGSLRLSPVTTFEHRRAPVDMFFRSLADAYGPAAAAVVLSGTGPNGSAGLKRVKEQGGLTIAQDPAGAQFGDMPNNSIATGLVDYVLPTSEMAARIVAYHEALRRASRIVAEPLLPDDDEPLREIMALTRARTGHDFSNYKPATVKRRIARRMSLHGVATAAEYARLMRQHPDEAVSLMKELLISVTNFFRDPRAFTTVEQSVVPRLFMDKTESDQIRVWCAGCATGEEPYSLAMLLVEAAGRALRPPAIQIFASDLDAQAIAAAREGRYSDADVADVSHERLQRFFQRDDGGYRVRRELRGLVLFAQHNVIKDPPFSHLDLVSCRNLLIYLNRTAQQRVLERFHFALRPGGFLLLGGAETAEAMSELFLPLDKAAHVFQSRNGTGRVPVRTVDRPAPPPATSATPAAMSRLGGRMSPADLHLRLLEQLGPPSIVVTDEHVVVHVTEHAGRFLQVSGGEPSRDLMKLVHPDLRVDLRTALHLAVQQRAPVEVTGGRLNGPGGDRAIKIIVKPAMQADDPLRGHFLVLFEEQGDASRPESSRVESYVEAQAGRDELDRVKAQLRATVDQYETQAEQRKAANEELQAMNEELRSGAEELETSKEELESVNEELTTVNQELKVKVEELKIANNDLQNLINSTEMGVVFLDRSRRVKLSTPQAQQVFKLLPTDVGRPLSDIRSDLNYPELEADVEQVLGQLRDVEREVTTPDGRWYYLHIVPYRTSDDRIDGVVITLQDITRRRRAERRVGVGEERFRLLVDSTVDYAILTMTPDGVIDSWNPGAERVFGYRPEEVIGKRGDMLFTPEDRALGIPEQELERAARTGRAEDERWHLRKGGVRFYSSGVTTRLGDDGIIGFAKIARDLTEQRRTELALEQTRAELEERVRQRTAELQAEVDEHTAARETLTALVRKMVTAQEDERTRIARDLHDQLGQQMTALRMGLERHRQECGSAHDDLDRVLELARRIDEEVDFLSWELRPPVLDDLGLPSALARYVSDWSEHYGVPSQFQRAGELPALAPEVELTFYRITQEALTNIVKHSRATRVDVLLEARDDTVVLVVEDNGIGFDLSALAPTVHGIGIDGMRERARLIRAAFDIESSPGSGTTVYLRWRPDAPMDRPA